MNDRKLKNLFGAARGDMPPAPPEDFGDRVMRSVRREQRAAPPSLWEQLDNLFPRLAVATVVVMVACLAADFGYSMLQPSSLTDDINEISEQWLFASNGEANE